MDNALTSVASIKWDSSRGKVKLELSQPWLSMNGGGAAGSKAWMWVP